MEEEDYNYDQYQYEYEPQDNNYSQSIDDIEVPEHLANIHSHGSNSHDADLYNLAPYEIIPLENLYMELTSILDDINTIVYLGKGWSLLLFKEFKWDKQFLKEEYYNNMEKYQRSIGLSQNLQNPNNFNIIPNSTCDVCLSQPVPILVNICGHGYCLECWLGHLKGGLLDGNPFLRCMWDKCRAPLLLQTVEQIFDHCGEQGKIWRIKYQKKICQLFITNSRNFQFCTGVDCTKCIRINQLCVDTVQCTCTKVFCFRCQSDDHYPCKCDQKQKWIQQVLSQEADAKWIAANAKVCPWCKKAVERSMGCNFMACKCGKSFCYMCSQPWQPDHKDHFKCHLFKKKPDEIVNRQKEIMQRMNHCTERYLFNQAVANNYKQIDVFAKRKYLFKTIKLQLVQTQFLENAYKFAIECCQRLKWIYAFTYFTELTTHQKQAFDFSLGEYEKYKENLLKLLAADLKMLINDVEKLEIDNKLAPQNIQDFQEKFKTMKKSIVNYHTCTKSFKEKFVSQLKRITQKLDQDRQIKQMKNYQPSISLPTQKSKSGDKEEKKGGLINNAIDFVKAKIKKAKE